MGPSKFVIVTGLSGAGKSEAVKCLEDLGFFCVDNMPPTLIPKFAELFAQSEGKVNKVAIVTDARGGRFFDSLLDSLASPEVVPLQPRILFLEASDEVLVRRFKAVRRRHPLSSNGSILDGIYAERKTLENVKESAAFIIDTSDLSSRELKQKLTELFDQEGEVPKIHVTAMSFGFKYGLPMDADLVFDVRFLPNPYYVESLKNCTGDDKSVQEYVLKWQVTKRFMVKLTDLMEFLLPYYISEGKNELIVAIGCTGGKHRSVTLAAKLGEHLSAKGYQVTIEHRDIKVAG
jgi:UPF0042 nucleotide-binding protein